MSLQILCSVCTQSYRRESIRVLPTCGHGFCMSCIYETRTCHLQQFVARVDSLCPSYRTPFKARNAIQIYLQSGPSLDSPTHDQSARLQSEKDLRRSLKHASEGLAMLDVPKGDCEVAKLSRELLCVAQTMRKNRRQDDVSNLIATVAVFIARISPHFGRSTLAPTQARLKDSRLIDVISAKTKTTDLAQLQARVKEAELEASLYLKAYNMLRDKHGDCT